MTAVSIHGIIGSSSISSYCHLPSFMAVTTTLAALLITLQLMLRKGLKHVDLDKEKRRWIREKQTPFILVVQ